MNYCPKCDEPEHVTFPDCEACRGSGHHIGGDALRSCPSCNLRSRYAKPVQSPVVRRALAGTLPEKDLTAA